MDKVTENQLDNEEMPREIWAYVFGQWSNTNFGNRRIKYTRTPSQDDLVKRLEALKIIRKNTTPDPEGERDALIYDAAINAAISEVKK